METKKTPIVECQMMVREPVSEVFQAFIDQSITTKFWFTKSSAPLQAGETVTWQWEMYNVTIQAKVKEIIANKSIAIQWGDPSTNIDFEFTTLTDQSTYVVVKNYGFSQTGDELIEAINNNAGGFTTMLDGLKAYLEHGIVLNLVRDKFPNLM